MARDAPVLADQSFRQWWRSERPISQPEVTSPRGPRSPTAGGSRRNGAELGFAHLLGAVLPASLSRARRRPQDRSTRPPASQAGSGREAVLGAVRRALRSAPMGDVPIVRAYRQAGQTVFDDLLALFVERASYYRAEVSLAAQGTVASEVAGALLHHGGRRVLVPADLAEDYIPSGRDLVVERDSVSLGALEIDTFDAAVSTCAVAIADTGTVVLDGGPGQGRRVLSLVPDHLVVVVEAGQVVAGVPDAFAKLSSKSVQTWISGPSATVDIELTRVEGVHGPRKLSIILVRDDQDAPGDACVMPALQMEQGTRRFSASTTDKNLSIDRQSPGPEMRCRFTPSAPSWVGFRQEHRGAATCVRLATASNGAAS